MPRYTLVLVDIRDYNAHPKWGIEAVLGDFDSIQDAMHAARRYWLEHRGYLALSYIEDNEHNARIVEAQHWPLSS